MDDWLQRLSAALGHDVTPATAEAVLEAARDVAHATARPNAPLACYALGVYVGRRLAAGQAAGAALAEGRRLIDSTLTPLREGDGDE